MRAVASGLPLWHARRRCGFGGITQSLFSRGAGGLFLLAGDFAQHNVEPFSLSVHELATIAEATVRITRSRAALYRLLAFRDHLQHVLLRSCGNLIATIPVGTGRNAVDYPRRVGEDGLDV